MKIDKVKAAQIIRDAAVRADSNAPDPYWVARVERLSQLCADGGSNTHIAFLGTAILAKSVSNKVDLVAIKPQHAPDNPNAYSARTLCHSVLVPLSAELGFSIGVTGREPLNNQPYFRMTHLGDGTPVHSGARDTFDAVVELVSELDKLDDEESARKALSAFIAVRRRYQPRYVNYSDKEAVTPDQLEVAIVQLVAEGSERGRRAQAIVAGLMDVFAGPERVESGRINDPSRSYPGDVCVRAEDDSKGWQMAIEVRDKPVSVSDAQVFGKKCVDMGVREAAIVMVSERQTSLDRLALSRWANGFGIGLTLFHGWQEFVEQALFWSGEPKPDAALRAVSSIHNRLVSVEASPTTVELWHSLLKPGQTEDSF